MKKKITVLFLLITLVSILVGCEKREEVSLETEETTVEETIEESIEEAQKTEEDIYEMAESTEEIKIKEEEFVLSPEILDKKFMDIFIFYQENFIDMTDVEDELERAARAEVAGTVAGFYEFMGEYENMYEYNICSKDGINIGSDESLVVPREMANYKMRLFEEFMIQSYENGNEDFSLVEYIQSNNFYDVFDKDVEIHFGDDGKFKHPRYTTLPRLYNFMIENQIEVIKISTADELPEDFHTKYLDTNGFEAKYWGMFENIDSDKMIDYRLIGMIVFDENGNFMF